MMRVFEQSARSFYRRHCHAYDSLKPLATHVNRDRLNAAINQGPAHAAATAVEAVVAVTEAATTHRKSAYRLVVNFLQENAVRPEGGSLAAQFRERFIE